jgi:hypothetical protein
LSIGAPAKSITVLSLRMEIAFRTVAGLQSANDAHDGVLHRHLWLIGEPSRSAPGRAMPCADQLSGQSFFAVWLSLLAMRRPFKSRRERDQCLLAEELRTRIARCEFFSVTRSGLRLPELPGHTKEDYVSTRKPSLSCRGVLPSPRQAISVSKYPARQVASGVRIRSAFRDWVWSPATPIGPRA